MLSLLKKNFYLISTSPILNLFLILLPFIALPLTKHSEKKFPLNIDKNRINYLNNTPSIFNLSTLPSANTTEHTFLYSSFTNKTLGLLFTDHRTPSNETNLNETKEHFINFIQSDDYGFCFNTSHSSYTNTTNNNCTLVIFQSELNYILSSKDKIVNELMDINIFDNGEMSFNVYSRLFPLYDKENQLSTLYNIPVLMETDYINTISVYFMKFLKWKHNKTNTLLVNDTNNTIETIYIHPMNVSKYVRFTDNHTGIYPYPVSCMSYMSSFFIGLSFSFIGVFYIFSSIIIEEQQHHIKDLLRFQGISTFRYVLSWYITYILIMIIPLTVFAACFVFMWLKIQLYTLLFLGVVLFFNSLNVIAFSFLAAVFVSGKNTSTIGVYIIYSLVMLFYFLFTYFEEYDKWLKIIFYMFPNVNLSLAFEFLFLGTNYEHGMDLNVMHRTYKSTSFFTLILMNICVWVVISLLLSIQEYYTNKNKKHKHVKTDYMLFDPKDEDSNKSDASFKHNNNNNNYNIISSHSISEILPTRNSFFAPRLSHKKSTSFNRAFEPVSEDKYCNQISSNMCLMVRDVSKRFKEFKAVKQFTCNFFKGQIFVLLGENGAGKSTMLNMISGRTNVDHGSIKLNSVDIIENKQYLYSNLGLCLQEDIYFKELTVTQQIELVCNIKLSQKKNNLLKEGSNDYKEESQALINGLGLSEYKNVKAKRLSGGNLRKLCIAFALISNSELVILDEPTSGMDFREKKSIWDFLKTIKSNRIIIITTHSMEEAEYLGDSIGIMSEGELICRGSSSFLKRTYPCGFNINLILNETNFNDIKHKTQLMYKMKLIEPKMVIKIFGRDLIKINFPDSTLKTKKLESIFKLIEMYIEQKKINNYTVSTTSLEDVFFKVNDNEFTKNLFEKELADVFEQVEQEYKYQNKDQEIKELVDDTTESFIISNNEDSSIMFRQRHKEEELKSMVQNDSNNNIESNDDNNLLFNNNNNNIIRDDLHLALLLNDDKAKNDKLFIFKSSIIKRHLKRLWLTTKRRYFVFLFHLFVSAIFLVYIVVLKPITLSKYFYFNFIRNFYPNDQLYQYQLINETDRSDNSSNINQFIYNTNLTFQELNIINSTSQQDAYINIVESHSFDPVKDFIFINYTHNEIEYHNFFSLSSPTINYVLVNNILQKHLHNYGINSSLLDGYTLSPQQFRRVDIHKVNYNDIIVSLLVISQLISSVFSIETPLTDQEKEITLLISLAMSNTCKYWISLFIIDYLKYITITLISFGILSIILVHAWILFPLSLFAGINYILLAYLFVSLLKRSKFVNILYLCLNIITVFVTLFVNEYSHIATQLNLNLCWFDLWPVMSVTQAMFDIREAYLIKGDLHKDILYRITIGIVVSVVHSILLIICMLLVEGGYVAKWSNRVKNCLCSGRTKRKKTMDKKSTPTQRSSKKRLISINYSSLNSGEHSLNKSINQETVLAEKEKVINNKNMFSFIIQNLIVIYSSLCGGNKVAISKLYLGLKPKERFALVGHSGAGKTTIIKSILNQTPIIDGHILLNNINMSKHIVGLHNKIGYCPQSNSLFDYLTVKETFEFYDKGIVSDIVNDCTSLQESISNRITNLLSVFGLYKYRDSLTKDLSGGNKRKVLFAIALMNNPELILLDEPSTGVDPDSRRLMWRNVLAIYRNKDVKKNNFNMIVATQCFEEAEVLCDNLGWLEKGKFSYIGNSENLKLELSEGYYLKVKFKKPDENEKKMIVEHIQFNQMNNLKKMENFKINEKDLHVINDVTNLEQISYLYYLDSFLDILFNEKANVKFLDCFENQFLLVLHVEQQRKAYMFANLLNITEIQHDIIEISIGIQPFETFIIDDVNDDMS